MDSVYKDMASILEERSAGDYELKKFTIKPNTFVGFRDYISPGNYISLLYKQEVVMSNTNMEQNTNRRFVYSAHGDILIGGLGIGMIILAIQDDPKVKTITVLEKSDEVIEIVGKQLPLNDKVKIIKTDVFEYKPKQKFDCIYMDIWNFVNSDVYNESMKPLKRKYSHFLKPKTESPDRFNECWAEYEAKHNRRLA